MGVLKALRTEFTNSNSFRRKNESFINICNFNEAINLYQPTTWFEVRPFTRLAVLKSRTYLPVGFTGHDIEYLAHSFENNFRIFSCGCKVLSERT